MQADFPRSSYSPLSTNQSLVQESNGLLLLLLGFHQEGVIPLYYILFDFQVNMASTSGRTFKEKYL